MAVPPDKTRHHIIPLFCKVINCKTEFSLGALMLFGSSKNAGAKKQALEIGLGLREILIGGCIKAKKHDKYRWNYASGEESTEEVYGDEA